MRASRKNRFRKHFRYWNYQKIYNSFYMSKEIKEILENINKDSLL